MKRLFIKAIILLFMIIPAIFAFSAQAGIDSAFENVKSMVSDSETYNNTISINTLSGDIIQLALSILGVLCVIFMIYAGYLWLTAAGNEQRIDKAKTILFEAIIGLVIVIAAYAISYFVIYAFKGQVNL